MPTTLLPLPIGPLHSAVQCSAVQCSAVPCEGNNTVHIHTFVKCDAMQLLLLLLAPPYEHPYGTQQQQPPPPPPNISNELVRFESYYPFLLTTLYSILYDEQCIATSPSWSWTEYPYSESTSTPVSSRPRNGRNLFRTCTNVYGQCRT
jgi:hypothetical protein